MSYKYASLFFANTVYGHWHVGAMSLSHHRHVGTMSLSLTSSRDWLSVLNKPVSLELLSPSVTRITVIQCHQNYCHRHGGICNPTFFFLNLMPDKHAIAKGRMFYGDQWHCHPTLHPHPEERLCAAVQLCEHVSIAWLAGRCLWIAIEMHTAVNKVSAAADHTVTQEKSLPGAR